MELLYFGISQIHEEKIIIIIALIDFLQFENKLDFSSSMIGY